jgi:hypothetical protein
MKTIVLLFAMVLGVTAVSAQTRSAIKLADLPKAITDNISTQHQGWNAIDAFKVDTKGVMTYEVLVKKATSEMNFVYDKDGKYLKMEPHKLASNTAAKPSGTGSAKPASAKKSR